MIAIPATMSTSLPRDAQPVEPARVINDVLMQFQAPEGPLVAVDHMSFSVKPGEFVSIIGPSGCGKSTLFNIVGGLVGGYEGNVTVAGERV